CVSCFAINGFVTAWIHDRWQGKSLVLGYQYCRTENGMAQTIGKSGIVLDNDDLKSIKGIMGSTVFHSKCLEASMTNSLVLILTIPGHEFDTVMAAESSPCIGVKVAFTQLPKRICKIKMSE